VSLSVCRAFAWCVRLSASLRCSTLGLSPAASLLPAVHAASTLPLCVRPVARSPLLPLAALSRALCLWPSLGPLFSASPSLAPSVSGASPLVSVSAGALCLCAVPSAAFCLWPSFGPLFSASPSLAPSVSGASPLVSLSAGALCRAFCCLLPLASLPPGSVSGVLFRSPLALCLRFSVSLALRLRSAAPRSSPPPFLSAPRRRSSPPFFSAVVALPRY
jgi:hypothetical protein